MCVVFGNNGDQQHWYDDQRRQFILSEIERIGLSQYLREVALAKCELAAALEFEKLRPVILESTPLTVS